MTSEGFPSCKVSGFDLDRELADSGLTVAWLLDTLWKHCPDFHDTLGDGVVEEVTARDISDGKGFVSKVYKTTIKLVATPSDSFTVMLKVPTRECLDTFGGYLGKRDGKKVPHFEAYDVFAAHNVECQIYDLLRDINSLPIAKTWFTQQASDGQVGVIMMADLAKDGVNLEFATSLALQQIKNIVRDFAVFHSYILGLDEEATKKWHAVCTELNFHFDNFLQFLGNMIARVPAWRQEPYKRLLDQLKPTMTKEFGRYSLIDRPQELGLPLTLCLGDTGAHNMFFKKSEDGTASNEVSAYIDFQNAFAGNQMFDVARIICGCCDADVRREAELTLVEDYYNLLVELVVKKGRSVDFGVKQLHEVYALAGAHQTMFTIAMVGSPLLVGVEYPPAVHDAWREKILLRAKLLIEDTIKSLKTFAPQFLAQ